MPRKRRPTRETAHQPQAGVSGQGQLVDPLAGQTQESDDASSPAPQAAPAPGIPIDPEQFERLKTRATIAPRAHRGKGEQPQQDPATKK